VIVDSGIESDAIELPVPPLAVPLEMAEERPTGEAAYVTVSLVAWPPPP
jgi:hypothetical protein